ncbi:MAG TPA: S8 family serine peptidase [Candidatus Polarisedimenticolaceae bacterium]|nr:S8 family serine peptidase [Candidatus Polarisedimenticolaceae bacterium]
MFKSLANAVGWAALSWTAVHAGTDTGGVALRSGIVGTDRAAVAQPAVPGQPGRWIVRFRQAAGWSDRSALEAAGARVVAPLSGDAFLVDVPAGRTIALSKIPGVQWAGPYLPQDKIGPEIEEVRAAAGNEDRMALVVHLFPDVDPHAVGAELSAAGLEVTGAGRGGRFGRVVLLAAPSDAGTVATRIAERNDVFWVGARGRRTLANDTSVWVGQSGLNGGMTTPIFSKGIYGAGQIAAVLDTGLDADACYFRDAVVGLPLTNIGNGTAVNPNHRKVLAVDFLWTADDPANPTRWDSEGHGTHVAGTLAGDFGVPILHDTGDGMAPAAKLVIQDAGYAADACGDLPGIGCPVSDLTPVFQQAYDQGARVHSNSWNDNENAPVQNFYSDASVDVDAFMWSHPDFLIVFACGNNAFGGFGTIGSPSTAKNGMATGATYNGPSAIYLSDISAWGPTADGRIKPDVLFPGASIASAANDSNVTTNNCSTQGRTGTSMTAPGVSGMALLTRQYFMDGWYPSGAPVPGDGFTPSAALLKAMLVNSAVAIQFDAEGRPITIPGNEQGWGRVLLDNALHFSGDKRGLWVQDNAGSFTSPADAPIVIQLNMTATGEPLKVTLAWTDYPSTPAATNLVNDLDLRVDGPSGGFWGNQFFQGVSRGGGTADRLNNLEQVLIANPASGNYSIQISPHAIPAGPQSFSLVVTGGSFTVTSGPHPSYWSHVVDDSGPNGNGDGVLDPGETAKIQVTLRNAGDAAATSVLGQLYSAYPGTLKVYDGAASYPDMPVGAQGNSTSPHYEVTLEPSASCGQVLGATMQVTGTGFDVGSAFTTNIGTFAKDYPSTGTPVTIPRNNTTGVTSTINVPVTFPLTEADVTVNIDHPNIADLDVLFYRPGPTNPPVYLHNNTQPGVSGIHTNYDEQTLPDGPGSLDDFIGGEPMGSWRLKAVNTGNTNGTLQNWTLHLKSTAPFNCHPVSCGQAVPPAVGNTLTVNKSGTGDVQLSWTGVGAANYNVWRSSDPAFSKATFDGATGGAATWVDTGAQTLPGLHVYLVRSVNACRWESP